jgi:hypothetical protein
MALKAQVTLQLCKQVNETTALSSLTEPSSNQLYIYLEVKKLHIKLTFAKLHQNHVPWIFMR